MASDLGPEELEQLRSGLRALALRALGDAEAADEVAQETLVRALDALRRGRFRQGERLGAFVRGIARHVIADIFRTRERICGLEALPRSAQRSPPGDALSSIITAEEKKRLRAALELLSPGDHEILQLCYFEGLTPARIAELLGEPPDRIRKRKSRALARLRSAFLEKAAAGHETG